MARAQVTGDPLVDAGIRQPGVAVVANPVDTFVRQPVDSQAEQLARALGQFAPELGRLGTTLQVNRNEDLLAAGKAEAARLNRLGLDYAAEVKAGRLPINNNPFFQAGLQEVQGQNLATKYRDALVIAVGANEQLKTSTDINDFRKVVGDFSAQWQKDNNLDSAPARFIQGFSAAADNAVSQIEYGWAANASKRAKTAASDAIYTASRDNLMTDLRKGIDPTQIASQVFDSGFKFWSGQLGMEGRTVNATHLRAIISAAHELANGNDQDRALAMKALEVARHVQGGGPGAGSLSSQQWASEDWETALRTVGAEVYNGDAHAAQQQAAEHEQQTNDAWYNIIHKANTDETYNPRADLDALAHLDPSKFTPAWTSFSTLKGEATTNQPLYQALYRRIWNEGNLTESDIASYVHRDGLSVADADNLMQAIRTREAGTKDKAPINDPELQQVYAEIPGLFSRALPDGNGGFFKAENSETAAAVRADVTFGYVQWRLGAGKDASSLDRQKYVQDLLARFSARQGVGARPRQGVLTKTGGTFGGPAVPPLLGQGETPGAESWRKVKMVSQADLNTIRKFNTDHRFTSDVERIVNNYILPLGLDPASLTQFIAAQDELYKPAPSATP